jgi:hypothetical protein
MKTHRFYKDNEGWFIDLPGFPGPKAALAMVAGADTMLDKLSGKGNEITLTFSNKPIDPASLILERQSIRALGTGGADYTVASSVKKFDGHELWLCPVTLYVFGKYPKRIWVG